MPVVRIEHAVPSFESWKQAFERDPADRKGSGVRRYQILRRHEDANHVLIDLEFATHAEALAFLRKMEGIWNGAGKAVMREPRASILDIVETRDL